MNIGARTFPYAVQGFSHPERSAKRAVEGRGAFVRSVSALVAAMACLLAPGANAQEKLHDATFAVPAFSLSFALHYLADDLGLWQKHGLNMKSVLIAGVGSANAVISGSADAGDASPPTLTRAVAHGQKLMAIGAMQNRLFVEAVLRKDLAQAAGFDPKAPLARRVQALKGRTIAVESINSIIHAYVRLLAHIGAFDPEDIRIAPMQPPNMIAAFETHQIDGFAMSLPWPLVPVLKGEAVKIASGLEGDPPDMVPFAQAMVVVRPDTCETRKWLCEGVGGALADGAAFVHDHPADALQNLAKHFPTLEPKLVAAAFDELKSVTPRPPAPTREELANAETLNIEAGLLKPEERLKSYDGIFTDKYVK
jgi:NitT/TauT family transport system substrate-binding protein